MDDEPDLSTQVAGAIRTFALDASLDPPFQFDCPHCQRPVTIAESDHRNISWAFQDQSEKLWLWFDLDQIDCPAADCRKPTFSLELRKAVEGGGQSFRGPLLFHRRLFPESSAKSIPDYVPQAIRDDYVEACKIRDLSAKASATLARRCLQGMIRDVWKVVKPTLFAEIDEIKDRVEPAIWTAIDAVRATGNVGAHMEKDVDQIIDVQPEEAETLIRLIELLIEDWYIRPHARKQQIEAVIQVGDAKANAQGKQPRRP